VANCFLSGTCPGNIPRTPGFGDFIPDFSPQCEGPTAAFLPSCGQTIPGAIPGVFSFDSQWTKDFLREFLKFSGGPNGEPTCAGEALRNTGDWLNPFTLSPSTFAPMVGDVLQRSYYNRALFHAMSRGLMYPFKSSIFRAYLAAGVKAPIATMLVAVQLAAAYSTVVTSRTARAGQCAAAFPIL
jgi:hypothetical protein